MNNVGSLLGKRVHHLSLKWEIENYFTRPEKLFYKSKHFIFGGAAWRLSIYPNGNPFDDSKVDVAVFLERLKSFVKVHDVSYTIGIKNGDGTVYNCKKCTYCFEEFNTRCGYDGIATKTNMLNAQTQLAPEGTLTVFIENLVLHKIIMDESGGEQSATPTDEHKNKDDYEKGCKKDDNVDDKNDDIEKEEDDDDENDNEIKEEDADDDDNVDSDDESDEDTDFEGTDILIKNLKNLFLNEEDYDVTFKVEDKEIHAHRAVLVARSPVFASMFRHDMKEKNSGNVNIPDCGAEAFKELLLYLYSGTVAHKSPVVTFDLYEASVKYELEHLKKKCIKFMKMDMSSDTFCDILAISLKYNEMELINCATDFFAMNMKRILPTVKWQMFLKDYHIAANELLIKAMEKNFFF